MKIVENKNLIKQDTLASNASICSDACSCNCDEDGSCWGPCKCFDMNGEKKSIKSIYQNE